MYDINFLRGRIFSLVLIKKGRKVVDRNMTIYLFKWCPKLFSFKNRFSIKDACSESQARLYCTDANAIIKLFPDKINNSLVYPIFSYIASTFLIHLSSARLFIGSEKPMRFQSFVLFSFLNISKYNTFLIPRFLLNLLYFSNQRNFPCKSLDYQNLTNSIYQRHPKPFCLSDNEERLHLKI